jgi:hypothetical protein
MYIGRLVVRQHVALAGVCKADNFPHAYIRFSKPDRNETSRGLGPTQSSARAIFVERLVAIALEQESTARARGRGFRRQRPIFVDEPYPRVELRIPRKLLLEVLTTLVDVKHIAEDPHVSEAYMSSYSDVR